MIYLITCDKFKLEYVGKTSYKLNDSFSWHNSCCRYPEKDIYSVRFFMSISKKVIKKVSHLVLPLLKS